MAEHQAMLRTVPKAEYRCATCGELHDLRDMYFHRYRSRRGLRGVELLLVFPERLRPGRGSSDTSILLRSRRDRETLMRRYRNTI